MNILQSGIKINKLLSGYNLSHPLNLIDIEDFLKNLEKIGGFNSELIEDLKEKDITDLAPNMPKWLVRSILTQLKMSVKNQQPDIIEGSNPRVVA